MHSLESNSCCDFLDTLTPDTRLLIEFKINIMAIDLQCKDGKLEKSISIKGIDVSSKISEIQNLSFKLPVSGIM